MKTIIVATDFSPVASNALQYSIEMAKVVNGSLLLFHAYQIPVAYTEVPLMLISVEELKKNAEAELEKLKLEVEHLTSGAIKINTEAQMGNTIDELETLCKKINPFAVVMGAKGTSGLEKVLFGSTLLTAIRHLTWPVICVPPGKQFGNGIKKIGFACDFREVEKTTPGDAIKSFVSAFHAELHVLNVDYHDKHFKPETPEQLALLYSMLEESKPVYHFIEHEDVEDGIYEFVETNKLDLIITIPKKQKLLDALFNPSSTKQLVFQSQVPVMCVHE